MTAGRDEFYLRHILEAIDRIQSYTEGIDSRAFRETPLVQDAVIRQLEIVGEAARHVSDQLRSENSEVRWRDMAGMRDRLIHGYFGVDLDTVWATVQSDLPTLRDQIRSVLGMDSGGT